MIDYFKNLVVDAGAERGGGARKMPKSYMKRNSTVPMSVAMSPAVSSSANITAHITHIFTVISTHSPTLSPPFIIPICEC